MGYENFYNSHCTFLDICNVIINTVYSRMLVHKVICSSRCHEEAHLHVHRLGVVAPIPILLRPPIKVHAVQECHIRQLRMQLLNRCHLHKSH